MTRPTFGGPAATAEDDSVATAAVALARSGPGVGGLVVASTSRGVVMHVAAHRPAGPVIAALLPDARRVVVLTAGDDAAHGDRIELVTRDGRRGPIDAS